MVQQSSEFLYFGLEIVANYNTSAETQQVPGAGCTWYWQYIHFFYAVLSVTKNSKYKLLKIENKIYLTKTGNANWYPVFILKILHIFQV